jgi:hypothetical protein
VYCGVFVVIVVLDSHVLVSSLTRCGQGRVLVSRYQGLLGFLALRVDILPIINNNIFCVQCNDEKWFRQVESQQLLNCDVNTANSFRVIAVHYGVMQFCFDNLRQGR